MLDPSRLELFRYFEEEAATTGATGAAVNSVSFHKSGEQFVTATDDGFLELFDAPTGTKLAVMSTEAGCQHVRFTHSREAILCVVW